VNVPTVRYWDKDWNEVTPERVHPERWREVDWQRLAWENQPQYPALPPLYPSETLLTRRLRYAILNRYRNNLRRNTDTPTN